MRKQKDDIMTIDGVKQMITLSEAKDMFNDYLDSDSDGLILIAGLTFLASEVLERMDPVAYRTELNDYLNAISYDFDIIGY